MVEAMVFDMQIVNCKWQSVHNSYAVIGWLNVDHLVTKKKKKIIVGWVRTNLLFEMQISSHDW